MFLLRLVPRHPSDALVCAGLVCTVLVSTFACESEPEGEASCEEQPAGELFTRRIAPLLVDDRPSSCNQCHLSGVDLGSFVRTDPCESMACLVERGLVYLERPERSLILSWIERAVPESDLITESVLAEEYQGFLQWISESARCGESECRGAVCGPSDAGAPFCEIAPIPAERSPAEPAPCDPLSIERSFRDTVYASRSRCAPCHVDSFDGEIPGDPVRWVITAGNCDQASLATLREIERRGYIDVEEPAQSALLLKPLDEAAGGVEHGGDAKFHSDDDVSYVDFVTFLNRYAECFGSR